MIHEIKFRAWDKANKEMLEVQEISFWQEKIRIFDTNDTKQNHYLTLPFCLLCMHFEDVEIMQSTGLQDKNGVEIFEGDIVKRFDKLIEVVEWNDKKGWWCLNDGSIGLTTLGQWHQAIEIIGNIYENKELLQ